MEQHTFNQKYRQYIQPNNQDVFAVLNSRLQSLVPGWERELILDFGCNNGHLIGTSKGAIPGPNLYGVDIHKPSLFIARSKYPQANWVHYNGYNATFNPYGEIDADFTLPSKVKIGIAYGVFTHMDLTDIKLNIERVKRWIEPGGWLIFSAWEDTDYQGYLRFLWRSFKIKGPAQVPAERSLYLINRVRLLPDTDRLDVTDADWVETFYKRSFLTSELGAEFLPGLPTLHQVFGIKC